MYDVHMASRMPYTISVISVFKFSVINLLKKIMAALRPVKKLCGPRKNRVHIPDLAVIK